MAQFATIGVYGFDGAGFIRALREAGVGIVLDVRQRRGVRGSEDAGETSNRRGGARREAGIGYPHLPERAPATEMRQLQSREDERGGEGKRPRPARAPKSARRYTEEVLD